MKSNLSSIAIARKGVPAQSSSGDASALHTILVVDDQAIYREPITASLQASGYRSISAANGKEALRVVEARKPDLVLLDVMMPEMDAWAFLQAVRTRAGGADLRIILLTSSADRDSILRARDLGVREYFLKDGFSLDELLNRVKRCLAQPIVPHSAAKEVASTARERLPSAGQSGRVTTASNARSNVGIKPVLTRQDVVARVEKFGQAKTLPGAVLNVINLANSPRSSVEDLVSALKQDPVLASRILQVANSPSYASRKGRVNTVEEAVRNIGLGIVCKMAASGSIFAAFDFKGPAGIDLLRCWQHSFAVAGIMDRLVERSDTAPAGLPHLIGLCHDLGEIVLRQQFAAEYAMACAIAARSGRPLEQDESEVFGIAHQELTGLLATKLGLPAAIAAPIDEFHNRQPKEDPGPASKLTPALSLADSFAHGLLLAWSAEARVGPFLPAEYCSGFGKGEWTALDFQALRGEVIINTNLLAKLSAADELALSLPLLPAKEVKLWYTRHASLSSFDPLGVALQFLAQTDARETLPIRPEDVAGYGGIVIALPRLAPGTTPLNRIERLRSVIRNAALPILCLSASGSGDVPPCSGATEFAEYPIALSRLHQFISKLGAV